jgi:hypothetical protein
MIVPCYNHTVDTTQTSKSYCTRIHIPLWTDIQGVSYLFSVAVTEYYRLGNLQTIAVRCSQFWRLGSPRATGESLVQYHSLDRASHGETEHTCQTGSLSLSLLRKTWAPSWGPHPHDLVQS